MPVARSTLDTRPLFEWLRREAYSLPTFYATYAEFEAELVEMATGALTQRPASSLLPLARNADGKPLETITDTDRSKAAGTGRSVARWTWERFAAHEDSERTP